jgi:hypothetical protein
MNERRSGINAAGWAAIGVSLLLSTITGVNAFAIQGARVAQNSKDIAELRSDGRNVTETLNEINLRTARMEEKLEILLPAPGTPAKAGGVRR